MSYYTRKKKVSDIAKADIDSAIGVSVQAWGQGLDDINAINKPLNPGRALIIDPTSYEIVASQLALGNAAFKNTGTSIGSVVIVGPDGKISPTILPPSATLDGFWKNLNIGVVGNGQHVGDVVVIPDESEQQLTLKVGDGLKITSNNATLNKSLTIELQSPNNIASISNDIDTLSASTPGENIKIIGDDIISTQIDSVTKTISVLYNGTQFSTITANDGQNIAASSSSNINIVGVDDITTHAVGDYLHLNYTGKQWKTLKFIGYNFNLMGSGTHTAQNRTDSLEIKAGLGIAIESDATTKKLTIRSQYREGLGGNIDGGNYGELYDGFTYDGGTYYVFDGGTY